MSEDIIAETMRRVAFDVLDFEANAKRLRGLARERAQAAYEQGQAMSPPSVLIDTSEEVLLDAAMSLEMLTKYYREREKDGE